MYDPFWEAVSRLELCGFKVLALTCDGLAANRRLFQLHKPSSGSLIHKVANPYACDGRDLFFFSDPSHLVKTVRNAWASSKRRLWVSLSFTLTINTNKYLMYMYSCNYNHSVEEKRYCGAISQIYTRTDLNIPLV